MASQSHAANESVWAVIPAYNESAAILRSIVSGIVSLGYDVVVVDDGSVEPVEERLVDLPVHIARHLTNLGQGAALQTGMDYALKNGAGIIVHIDADGQHDPTDIANLIAPIQSHKCDIVLGSRFIRSEDRMLVPLRKRLLLNVGKIVSYVFTGVWLTDTHNGFRALSRTAAENIRLHESGFAHATEILEHIRRSGLKYQEVPTRIRYTHYSQQKGQSSMNSINIFLDLIIHKLFR
jgi:glycosyltransferase involved in cell wall biosynthesis